MKTFLNAFAVIMIFIMMISSPILASGITSNATSKQTISQHHDPIVFAHDYDFNGSDWNTMIQWFINDGWPKNYLYAPTFQSKSCTYSANVDQANQLSDWVNYLLNTTGANKVDIVAHRVGGISARYYMRFLNGTDKVSNFVALGTPSHGNPNPVCYSPNSKIIVKLNEGDETPGGVLNDTIGNRTDTFGWVTYNGTHIPGNISYTSIVSPLDGFPPDSAVLDGANNIKLSFLNTTYYNDYAVYKIIRNSLERISPSTTASTPSFTYDLTIFSLFSLLMIFKYNKKRKFR